MSGNPCEPQFSIINLNSRGTGELHRIGIQYSKRVFIDHWPVLLRQAKSLEEPDSCTFQPCITNPTSHLGAALMQRNFIELKKTRNQQPIVFTRPKLKLAAPSC